MEHLWRRKANWEKKSKKAINTSVSLHVRLQFKDISRDAVSLGEHAHFWQAFIFAVDFSFNKVSHKILVASIKKTKTFFSNHYCLKIFCDLKH